MPRIKFEVAGLEAARLRLDDVGERARRPEPAMRAPETKLDLQLSEARKFTRGGWRRDTPAWISEKRRRGLDTRTLRATRKLESALVNATDGVTATVWNGVLKWGIRAGRSDIYYAQALSKGWTSTTGRVPARRMVIIDKIAIERIGKRIGRYVVDGVIA